MSQRGTMSILFLAVAAVAISSVVASGVSCSDGANTDTCFNGLVLLQQRAEVVKTQQTITSVGLGSRAPTNEAGYNAVAGMKSDEEMKTFIKRVAWSEARQIDDAVELSGVVPFYSGTTGTQSFGALREELRTAPWVLPGEGRIAPLSDWGYQRVALLKSTAHMMAFARRFLDSVDKKVSNPGDLSAIIPYYDGEKSVQTFEALSKELLAAPWAQSRNAISDITAADAPEDVVSAEPAVKSKGTSSGWTQAGVDATKKLGAVFASNGIDPLAFGEPSVGDAVSQAQLEIVSDLNLDFQRMLNDGVVDHK